MCSSDLKAVQRKALVERFNATPARNGLALRCSRSLSRASSASVHAVLFERTMSDTRPIGGNAARQAPFRNLATPRLARGPASVAFVGREPCFPTRFSQRSARTQKHASRMPYDPYVHLRESHQTKTPRERGFRSSADLRYRPLVPFLTAPGSAREPVLFTPAAVGAPELLASPATDGWLPGAGMPLFMPVVPVAGPGVVAPGPTLPELEAPGAG